MAKSSKVEDYWRQNNVENLLKELTQILARRMPPDPAVAIVEHLQKKFPKSFKISSDTTDILSKTAGNNLPRQSITSPHSDLQNESTSDAQLDHRSSNLSQVSGIVTIPSMGSAFTDLLKQETTSTKLAPEINIKNLVLANRLSQYAVKLGKNIRSDRDILEEELIKPSKTKSTEANASIDSTEENLQAAETHDQPSIIQLIKYKQQIHIENDRRVHRQKLAALAKSRREKESFIQSDLSARPEEIQQQTLEYEETFSHEIPTKTQSNTQLSNKPNVKSKEEEEILNDENIFRPRLQRDRARQKNKTIIPRSNTPRIHGRHMPNVSSTMKTTDGNTTCKLCGNILNEIDNQQMVQPQQTSAPPAAHSFQPQHSSQSVETTNSAVDDWFESSSDISVPRQSIPSIPDDRITPPIGSSTFRRDLFQPVNNVVEHRPPLIPPNDEEIKTNRLTTPRLSESGMFARSPDTRIRRPSSTRSSPSPIPKKHQTDSDQFANTLPQPTTTTTTTTTTSNRRMSGWSVREHSPDESDN